MTATHDKRLKISAQHRALQYAKQTTVKRLFFFKFTRIFVIADELLASNVLQTFSHKMQEFGIILD